MDDVSIKTLNLKERSITGGAVTLSTQVISQCITVASVIVLARLLTPTDYGTVAMVTSLTAFVGLFRDLGLSGATIQSRSISHEQISVLFWINVGLGTLITLVIAAAAPLIGWFYGKPELVFVTVGISFTSLLRSLGTQHMALLNRQMRFSAIAVVDVLALLLAFFAAVCVALSGGTYWALVANRITMSFLVSAGLWIASDFRPSWPRRGTGANKLVRFGANIVGYDIANYFRVNLDKILIGRVWGAQSLGLYNKAYSLLLLPMANIRYPLNRVAFPAMSRLQNDPERYKAYFVKYCSVLAFTSMPIVAVFYLCSESIILLFLGDRWLGAVDIFRILTIAGFIQAVASLRATVIMSSGHGYRFSRWGLWYACASVAAYACGLPWGAKGVAIAHCLVNYLILHPSLVYAFRDTPVRPIEFYRSIAKPCLASIIMSIIYSITIRYLPPVSGIFLLAMALPFCMFTYLAVFCLLPGGRKNLKEYWEYVTIIFRRFKRQQ